MKNVVILFIQPHSSDRLYWKNFLRVSHMPHIQLLGELQKAQFDYGNYRSVRFIQ